jgi:hypothetical protein
MRNPSERCLQDTVIRDFSPPAGSKLVLMCDLRSLGRRMTYQMVTDFENQKRLGPTQPGARRSEAALDAYGWPHDLSER